MPEPKHPLKVFLCHAHADKAKTHELYRYLRRRGVQPWLDAEDLVGGQDWRVEIPKAIRASDAIIICLSKNSINKEGFVQAEITFALEKALEIPVGRIFIIPARYEECEVPNSLERFHWVDLFGEDGFPKLMKSLKTRAGQLERATVEVPHRDEVGPNLASTSEDNKNKEQELALRKLENQAVQSELSVNFLDAANAWHKIKKIDPLYPNVDTKIKELDRKIANEKAEELALIKEEKRKVAEKAQRRTAQIAALRETLSKSFVDLKSILSKVLPFLRIAGTVGIIIGLFWAASWGVPYFNLFPLTARPTATLYPSVATISFSPNFPATQTVIARATSTPAYPKFQTTHTALATDTQKLLSTEMTDTKGVQMVLVPAGYFTMGHADTDGDEQPAHEVYLDSFYIDKYEVTNVLYKVCVFEGVCKSPQRNRSYSQFRYYNNPEYDNYPVIYVNWNMARTYCEWRTARLPTEAEWEKAARGTDERTYPWGEEINCNNANYYNGKFCVGDTSEVGNYENGKSSYGVYDMAGNVWEWVSSLYMPYPYSATDGREDLTASGYRVLRGGSWRNYGTNSRTSDRLGWNIPITAANDAYGFRCARDLNP